MNNPTFELQQHDDDDDEDEQLHSSLACFMSGVMGEFDVTEWFVLVRHRMLWLDRLQTGSRREVSLGASGGGRFNAARVGDCNVNL